MTTNNRDYDVIVAGAGPAGTGASIHLANSGFRVLLLEQKRFPRAKLCGEFISPECLKHFQKLGVFEAMMASNPTRLCQTTFYSSSGRMVTVPNAWFSGGPALGLSRSRMDNNLLEKARSLGVDVLEGAAVTEVIQVGNYCRGVRVRTESWELDKTAALTIDATGRSRNLVRRLRRENGKHRLRANFVAFKAHVIDAELRADVCEIYSYAGGYGGLSSVEQGVSNLCFIVSASDVRRCHSDADEVMRTTIMTNRRAAKTLHRAQRCSEWLTVSLERFGGAEPAPIAGLIAIGDSASFIDPFTGSGMLMALESAELAATLASRHLKTASLDDGLRAMRGDYVNQYGQMFGSRLRISGLLRRTAFSPRLAEMTIVACSLNKWLGSRLARATRSAFEDNYPTVPAR